MTRTGDQSHLLPACGSSFATRTRMRKSITGKDDQWAESHRTPLTGDDAKNSEIDAQHFVLSVDIWDQNATTPANEVKHSNTSPSVSISMASVTSYPPPPDHIGISPYYQGMQRGFPAQYPGGNNYGYGQHPPYTNTYATAQPGTFQRNLIGSLTVSATLLEDTDGKPSYWFVLQDLSVRTEGTFR